jgi:glycerophosphoryl diester phosphodiesterase
MGKRDAIAVAIFVSVALFSSSGCTAGSALRGVARPPAGFDVQGHRGARGLLPENTLVAFAHAIELGVTTLEMDLGVTRDGVVVVAHDPWIAPHLCLRADGAPIEGERGPLLRDLELSEVQAFDCGSLNPDPERFPEPPRRNVPGERIPTLREVFALVEKLEQSQTPGRPAAQQGSLVRFNLEIKSEPGSADTVDIAPFVAAVIQELRDAGTIERSVIQAFDWQVLREVKRVEPRLRTAALLAPSTLGAQWQAGLAVSEHGDMLGVLEAASDWVDEFSPYWRQLVAGEFYLGRAPRVYRAGGFRLVPWTVNDASTMRLLMGLGVDGIITDRPDILLEVLASEPARN